MSDNSEIDDPVVSWLRDAAKQFKTQAEMCDKSHISLRSYQDWLQGRDPRLSAIIKLAKTANKSLDDMVWPESRDSTLSADLVLEAMQALEEFLADEQLVINNPQAKTELVKALAENVAESIETKGSAEIIDIKKYSSFVRAVAS